MVLARSSIREELKRTLRDHLALAETHPPEECPLDVRSVAAALRISRTTLYKYGLNREINEAEQRQRENMWLSGAAIEQQFYIHGSDSQPYSRTPARAPAQQKGH
jgi:hypothetical protein